MLIFTSVQKFSKLLSNNMPIAEAWTNSEDSINGYYIDIRKKLHSRDKPFSQKIQGICPVFSMEYANLAINRQRPTQLDTLQLF